MHVPINGPIFAKKTSLEKPVLAGLEHVGEINVFKYFLTEFKESAFFKTAGMLGMPGPDHKMGNRRSP